MFPMVPASSDVIFLRGLNQNQLSGEIPRSLYMNHPPTAFRYVCAILMTLAEISSHYYVFVIRDLQDNQLSGTISPRITNLDGIHALSATSLLAIKLSISILLLILLFFCRVLKSNPIEGCFPEFNLIVNTTIYSWTNPWYD